MTDQEKEDRALDALMCQMLLQAQEAEPTEAEIEEFMNGPQPALSDEDEAALQKMGDDLPNLMKGWAAHEQGCMKVKNERPE
jgi:hypothetical protein